MHSKTHVKVLMADTCILEAEGKPPCVKMSWYQRSSNHSVRGVREKLELLGDQA